MSRTSSRTGFSWFLFFAGTSLVLSGCAADPPPIVVYEDSSQSVWVMFDPYAEPGHSHPGTVEPAVLSAVLEGLSVKGRDVVGGFGFFAEHEGHPAFSHAQAQQLAPRLAQALAKASPKDLATFYVISGDPFLGKVVTSGGVFLQDEYLYVVLANARTSPSSVQYENTYEIDTRSEPLLPIARYKFAAGFMPQEAVVPHRQALPATGYERYPDRSKIVVVNLKRIQTKKLNPAAAH